MPPIKGETGRRKKTKEERARDQVRDREEVAQAAGNELADKQGLAAGFNFPPITNQLPPGQGNIPGRTTQQGLTPTGQPGLPPLPVDPNPQLDPSQTPQPPVNGNFEVFENQQGITLPDGRTFLGLDEEDISDLSDIRQREQLPEGFQSVRDAAFARRQAAFGRGLAEQVDVLPALDPILESTFSPDFGEAGLNVARGAFPSLVGLVGQGGAFAFLSSGAGKKFVNSVLSRVGAAEVAGGAALAGGAGFGTAIAAFFAADAIGDALETATDQVVDNVESQFDDAIRGKQIVLQEGAQNLNDLVSDTNANPQNAARNLRAFNQQLLAIDKAKAELEFEARSNLKVFNSAQDEITEFNVFNGPGGERANLVREMQTALLNPDPTKRQISVETLQKAVNGR